MNSLLLIWTLGFGCGDEEAANAAENPVESADRKATPAASSKEPKVEFPKEKTQFDPTAPDDVAAAPADAQKTASGLAYKVLQQGPPGEKPSAESKVDVHYTGWTTDGKMFDSSHKRKKPASFGLNGVIAGWTEGIQLMVPGDQFRFWIPENLAYQGKSGRPQGMLVFDVELLKVNKPIPAPADVAAAPTDAQQTKTGLAWKVLKPGSGRDKPTADDTVEVHYTGWTTDGKMFDSSVQRGTPATFPLKRVIPGWTEGLQLMTEGEKSIFWIPEALAYAGKPGRPAGMLVFEIELLDLKSAPKTPIDVANPPAVAKKTASGLRYKVLSKGTGTEFPKASSKVTVHYSGWTTDGKMFDSSVQRGSPATFPLKGVIPGWTEGLQLMVVGEKTRFWIPEEMAYKGKPGRPQGMLVFDVELIEIAN